MHGGRPRSSPCSLSDRWSCCRPSRPRQSTLTSRQQVPMRYRPRAGPQPLRNPKPRHRRLRQLQFRVRLPGRSHRWSMQRPRPMLSPDPQRNRDPSLHRRPRSSPNRQRHRLRMRTLDLRLHRPPRTHRPESRRRFPTNQPKVNARGPGKKPALNSARPRERMLRSRQGPEQKPALDNARFRESALRSRGEPENRRASSRRRPEPSPVRPGNWHAKLRTNHD